MTTTAPALRWGVLLGAAFAASFAPIVVQLAFAVLAIGVLGMAHGASDLAIVARDRRAGFLAAYGLVSGVCLIWWVARPEVALPVFLLASALHFGMEDAPPERSIERVMRGASLVATPAALHAGSLQSLLHLAGGAAVPSSVIVGLGVIGGACALGLFAIAAARRDPRLFVGTAALLLMPPLVGFSVGFLVLHALPQTAERQRRLGCASLAAYFRATAPILAAAMLLVCGVAGVLLRHDPTGIRALFAGIAALAMPHLLVTPLFETSSNQATAVAARRTATI